MDRSNRKNEIVLLNILLCLLVVFIHVLSEPVTVLNKQSFAFAAVFFPWRLSAFAVQGFLFLSGLKLSLKSYEGKWSLFYRRRIGAVLIPYLFWNVIYYAYFVYHHYYALCLPEFAWFVALGTMTSHFYFIVVLVQFYVLFPLLTQLARRIPAAVGLTLSLLVTVLFSLFFPDMLASFRPGSVFPYNDRLFPSYLFYFIAGVYAGQHYEQFCDRATAHFPATAVNALLALAAEGVFSYLTVSGRFPPLGAEIVHMYYCVSMLLFLISLFRRARDAALPRFLIRLDRASYSIYLSHVLILYFVNDYILAKFFPTGTGVRLAVRAGLVFPASIGISMALHWFMTALRNRFWSANNK